MPTNGQQQGIYLRPPLRLVLYTINKYATEKDTHALISTSTTCIFNLYNNMYIYTTTSGACYRNMQKTLSNVLSISTVGRQQRTLSTEYRHSVNLYNYYTLYRLSTIDSRLLLFYFATAYISSRTRCETALSSQDVTGVGMARRLLKGTWVRNGRNRGHERNPVGDDGFREGGKLSGLYLEKGHLIFIGVHDTHQ